MFFPTIKHYHYFFSITSNTWEKYVIFAIDIIIFEAMENYNSIVNDWFLKLRNRFINNIHNKFPALRIEDIEDVYSEAFIAVRKNLLNGLVRENTRWDNYILTIGQNMAANKVKKESKFVQPNRANVNDDIDADEKFQTMISLKDLVAEDDNKELLEKRIEVLSREIKYLPEPCETILKSFYYGGFSMTEIMSEIHYKTTDAVKAMKYRCISRLKDRMMIVYKMLNLNI